MSPKITVFSAPRCDYCRLAKSLLLANDYSFEEIDIRASKSARAEFDQRTGNAKTVPQIFVEGTLIGGYHALVSAIDNGSFSQLMKD